MAKTFQEDNGSASAMRLMCFCSLIVSFIMSGATAFLNIEPQTGLTLTGMFLVAAFAPKAVQKFAEGKIKP